MQFTSPQRSSTRSNCIGSTGTSESFTRTTTERAALYEPNSYTVNHARMLPLGSAGSARRRDALAFP